MATSVLSTTTLNFTSDGSSTNAKLTASADTITLEGTSSGSCTLAGLSAPTSANHAATKAYVDNATNGLYWKDAVRCATTANIDLTTELQNGDTIDGVTLATGDRVLVKDQSSAALNGIYVVVASGSATSSRSTDLTFGSTAKSVAMFVTEGTQNGDTAWVCTDDDGSDIVGLDPLTFVQFSGGQSPGGSDTEIQYNNSGTLGGLSTVTTNGTNLSISGGDVTLADNDSLLLGAGSDLDLTHNGTNSLITSATGDLIVDNTAATGSTINRLGSDSNATDFQVQNDSASALFSVDGSGQADFSGNVDASGGIDIDADNQSLTIGAGADLSISHDGTNTTMTSTTGDLIIDNTNATGETVVRLGTDTSATYFGVHNNSDSDVAKFYADQTTTLAGELTVHADWVRSITVSTINTAGNETYTADQLKGKVIRRDPNGAGRTDTTPTAAQIVANIHDCIVGSSYEFMIMNTADADEDVTVAAGTGVTLVGTFVVVQDEIRRFEVVVTNATASSEAVTIYSLTSNGQGSATAPGGSDNNLQINSSGTFGGASNYNIASEAATSLIVSDNADIAFGTGSDFTISHDGTDTTATSATGDLIVDNTNVTGSTIHRLGTDTNATDFQVQNDSASGLFTVYGTGDCVTSDDLTVQGRIANSTTVTTESTASAVTFTAAEMWGGLIRRDPAGAARADLLDTAANIVGAVQDAEVGSSFEFVVENTADAAETITITTNTGLTLVGTMTIEQNQSRRFKAVMTNVTGASEAVTIYDYGAMGDLGGNPGGSDTQLQYNNAGEFGGLSTVTTDGTNIDISGGNLTLDDNDNLQIGTGGDLDISHDGTDSLIASTTGDLTIDNQNATGSTIFLLGSDTSATDFQIQNNSASALLSIDGSGAMDVTGATNFNDTTQSTSSTTGCVIFDGGLGIAKDVFCAGDMNAVAFNATSDADLKTDIDFIDNPLSKVMAIDAVQYRYNFIENDHIRYGVLAQDLEENGLGDIVTNSGEGRKVDYNNLVGLLIGAVQELKAEINDLKQ